MQGVVQLLELRPRSLALSVERVHGEWEARGEIQISSFSICERSALAAKEGDVVSSTVRKEGRDARPLLTRPRGREGTNLSSAESRRNSPLRATFRGDIGFDDGCWG